MNEHDGPPTDPTEIKLLEEGNNWKLAEFYAKANRHDLALQYLDKLVSRMKGDDAKCLLGYMRMGMLMEEVKDYKAAILYYTKVLTYQCTWSLNRYFMNNNIAYCLNQLGRYAEAETFCRNAIKIDPTLHNAYKNLGVSLEGQGRYHPAAECYSKAAMICPKDTRAEQHFEALWRRIREMG